MYTDNRNAGFGCVFIQQAYIECQLGGNIGVILAVIVSEAIMAVSIGTCIGFTIKNEGLSVGIINLAIPFL